MAHANTLPHWDSTERRQRRLAAGLVVSFLLHALVLSLQNGVDNAERLRGVLV